MVLKQAAPGLWGSLWYCWDMEKAILFRMAKSKPLRINFQRFQGSYGLSFLETKEDQTKKYRKKLHIIP